jgi:hypothetical protein
MFASMILDPLWQLYESAVVQQDVTKAANMASKGVRETKRLFYVIALQCFNDACVNYDLRVMLETPKLNSCILHFSILTLSLFLTL